MKYMTGKAKMMVTGIALGTVAAGGMAAPIAAGKGGGWLPEAWLWYS